MPKPSLDRMLAARSVAVVGASARPGSFGERLAIEALRSPGLARVHFVNPAYAEVQGARCVPSLADLPESPDLVLLGVPDARVPEQLALASSYDAGGAVVFGSAVGLGDAIRDAAGDLAVCGAGCMGFVNVAGGIRALGYLERAELPAGGIALVTHSGSMFSALLRTHRRLEYSLAVSSGQELVTTTGDYLCWALAQPETRVVGLFLEALRDGALLREGLARAAAAGVPVVALTVGTSPTGRAMVTAHSGAIAGDDAAWEALFTTYGVHRVRDVEELVDTLELFAVGRRVVRPAAGIATVHDSGAERVLVADAAAEEAVPFAPLAPATLSRLTGLLDHGLTAGNPLDVWGRGADTAGLFTSCLTAVADDPAVDVVALAIDLVEEYDGDESYLVAAEQALAATAKPVVVLSSVAAGVDQVQAGRLRRAGIPVLEGARSGLRAVRHLREHARSDPSVPRRDSSAPRCDSSAWEGEWLDARRSLDLLAGYGVATVPSVAAADGAAAIAAANQVGYPVVLKTDEPGIAHRAAAGGVRLGLADAAAVQSAYADLAHLLGPRVAVQPQLTSAEELALGVVRDPELGAMVLVAAGGTQIEELGRRALALPPLTPALAARMLERIGHPDPPTGMVEALLAVSRLALDAGDRLLALDVNPLLLTPDGPVAVDALVETSATAADPPA